MNCYLIVLLALSFLAVSCGTHKQGKIQVDLNQEVSIPVKLLIYNTDKDSTLIRLYIPIEFDLINKFNSKVRLSSGYLSLKGGNVQSGSISLLIDNKLGLTFRNLKFDTNEKKHFKAYTSYKIMIPNIEKEQILKDAEFAQHRFSSKKEVYNIGMIKDVPSFLLEKVPDSLKGFIRMEFYNTSTQKNFAKNIPVAF
ncbi:hypothetical protein [Aquimarina sp. I32.4]|uniref:hypothetical protein n=1 Tax=Aquimarina sp. I32.4 TaxID=2053903 RepID=UPI0011AFC928|nr:hypothetical protein [Aquimarina sp. I32.4]